MKALTLWQPYAKAIELGLKQFETRSWSTKYRGWLAIHSSIKPLSREYEQLAGKYGIKDLDFGKISVVCKLEDCILMTREFIDAQPRTEIEWGDWQPGRFAWKLSEIKVLDTPVSAKGRQGLWNAEIRF